MNLNSAKKITKAIVEIDHPLFDFRSKEAKINVKWVHMYLKHYVTKKVCQMLDVGCGTGKQSFAMEELGAAVTGIDCSREAIKYANNIKKNIKSDCNFIIGDYTDMPFNKNTFDIAIFPKNIIECSYGEVEKISKEIKKVLKIKGLFVLTMEDGIEKIKREKGYNALKKYQTRTGKFNENIILPNGKKYYYPIYFWTIAYAKYIFSKNFIIERDRKIDSNLHMLVFNKK